MPDPHGFLRITPNLIAIIAAVLATPGHKTHGKPLVDTTGVSRSSVYRALERCEAAGVMTSEWVAGRHDWSLKRRVYQLTDPDGAARAQRLVDDYANYAARGSRCG